VPGGKPYVREEDKTTRAFYKPYAPFFRRTPDDVAFFVDALRQRSGLPTSGADFPADVKAVRAAAAAFADAANSIYGFTFDLKSPDATQLDRFLDAHMNGAIGERVPNEPLLYYAMGCFWGEWLVRHRECAWALYAPLNPIQSFPDGLSVQNTICLQPFSQVNKRFSDPEGDNLAFKADITTADRKLMPPFPLIASTADADQAIRDLMPEGAADALDAWEADDAELALALFKGALDDHPNDPRLLDHAVACAWELERFDEARAWLERLVKLCPDRTHFAHNLAVLLTGAEETVPRAIALLEQALKVDPGYARARITLASLLHDYDLGRTPEAIRHCQWVLANEEDDELTNDAREVLKEIKSDRRGR
jgi:tetratricopeptide (TPR) repeat protein